MAYDAFLKLDGIDGESKTSGKEGWIELFSFSWGADHPASNSPSGRSIGKSNIHDIKLTKPLDASSPKLFLYCCTGKNFAKGNIYIRKAGEKPLEYLKMDFENLLITDYLSEGAGDDNTPTESLSLNFTKVDITYTKADASGNAAGTIVAGYDLKVQKIA